MFCPSASFTHRLRAGSTGLLLEQLHLCPHRTCPQIPRPQEDPILSPPPPFLVPAPSWGPQASRPSTSLSLQEAQSGPTAGPGSRHSLGAHFCTRRCLCKAGPVSWDSLWGLLTTPRLQCPCRHPGSPSVGTAQHYCAGGQRVSLAIVLIPTQSQEAGIQAALPTHSCCLLGPPCPEGPGPAANSRQQPLPG